MYWLLQTFQGFSPDEPVTVIDVYQLIEIVSPQFDRRLVIQAAESAELCDPNQPDVYRFLSLTTAVLFVFLFREWIASIEEMFRDVESSGNVSVDILFGEISRCEKSLSLAIARPPATTLQSAIQCISSKAEVKEISLAEFKRSIISSPRTREDISTLCRLPTN